ncbi:MAG: hypothetical protein BMS9Abin08_0846 [Gammaproteobacteria bacterium]|nr:MAG: hypothetical protein BMS9Abin08_0846 [Gammaproteobacteria bacterium]
MKTKYLLAPCLNVLVLALGMIQPVAAIPIADNYIGADNQGHGDVIGDTGDFQIFGMDASLSGTTLSVSINTTFAGKGDNLLFDWATNTPNGGGKGIGYGDLFLSSAWTPFGAPNYELDDASNGTTWSYGFALDDRWMNEGSAGTGKLYALSGDNSDILLSEDFLNDATFRNGQEVAVDTSGKTPVGFGNWNIDTTSQLVNFEINLLDTNLLAGPEIALHWGFTCANDVIEGAIDVSIPDESNVPEPGVLSLLGFGGLVMSLAGFVRRRRS